MPKRQRTTRTAYVSRKSKVPLPWYQRMALPFMRVPRRKVLRTRTKRVRSGDELLRRDEPTPSPAGPVDPNIVATFIDNGVKKQVMRNGSYYTVGVVPDPKIDGRILPVAKFIPMLPMINRPAFYEPAKRDYFQAREPHHLIRGDITVTVEIHGPLMADIDNLMKPTLDLLKGSYIVDDRQIKKLVVVNIFQSTVRGYYFKIERYEPTSDYYKPTAGEGA